MGVEKPIVVGHSWGTLVALSMALRDPAAISGLVLVSGYYVPTARLDVALQTPASLPVIGQALRYTIMPLLTRLTAKLAFKKMFSPLEVSPEFLAIYPLGLACRPSQLKSVADDTVEMPVAAARLRERLSEIRPPIYIWPARMTRLFRQNFNQLLFMRPYQEANSGSCPESAILATMPIPN